MRSELSRFSCVPGLSAICTSLSYVSDVKRRRTYAPDSECEIEGCPLPIKAKGLCNPHYMRKRRGSDDPTGAVKASDYARCSFDGCGRPVHGKGLCGGHYLQQREGRPLEPIREWTKVDGPCSVDECERDAAHLGLCNTHYMRKRTSDPEWARPIREKAPDGSGFIDATDGYRYLTIDGRRIQEHRYVMEQHLGRPLLPTETVHHRTGGFNGRSDNRLSNLELWTTKHPAGHRIEDVVGYAREMLALYGDDDERTRYAAT